MTNRIDRIQDLVEYAGRVGMAADKEHNARLAVKMDDVQNTLIMAFQAACGNDWPTSDQWLTKALARIKRA